MKQVIFLGYKCDVKTITYNNGRKAIVLVNAEDIMEDDMCPIPAGAEHVANATINIPEYPLKDDEVIIKDYSENEGIYDALLKAEVISPVIKTVSTGFITAPICKLLI